MHYHKLNDIIVIFLQKTNRIKKISLYLQRKSKHMAKERIQINPQTIINAITRAGFKEDEFLDKHDDVRAWIEGEKDPTPKQLEKFAEQVYLPFGYLFMDKFPTEKSPIPFFRTVSASHHLNLNIYDAIMSLQQRQNWMIDYMEENEMDGPAFIGKYKNSTDVNAIVNEIRILLELAPDWAFTLASPDKAVVELVKKIENAGCYVNFQSFVGNQNKRKIPVEDCRGFVLVDKKAPFIFINNNDSKNAQVFTLIHEFAHILIDFSAGVGLKYDDVDNGQEDICDRVAAAVLVEDNTLRRLWNEGIMKLSRKFKVSSIVIARRAMDIGLLTKEEFFAYYNKVKDLRPAPKKNRDGGNFYATALHRIGYSFLVHIRNAINSNQLLYRDAYALTGYSGNTFNKLVFEKL